MRIMQALKGSKHKVGVFATMFAACLLMFLPGCRAPLGPQDTVTEMGTVSIRIDTLDIGRAIQPDTVLADFTHITAVFTNNGNNGETFSANVAGVGTPNVTAAVSLPVGPWTLTVNAYLPGEAAGQDLLAASATKNITVAPGPNPFDIELTPIRGSGHYGTFSWEISFSPEVTVTAGVIQILYFSGGPIHDTVTLPDDHDDSYPWASRIELEARDYFVVFMIYDGADVATASMDLHIYRSMVSHFEWEFEADDFEPYIPVVSVTITGDGVDGSAGDFTLTLTAGDYVELGATVLPANASDPSVTWAVYSGNAYVTLTGNVLTAVAVGEAVITATAGGVTSTLTVTVLAPMHRIWSWAATDMGVPPNPAEVQFGSNAVTHLINGINWTRTGGSGTNPTSVAGAVWATPLITLGLVAPSATHADNQTAAGTHLAGVFDLTEDVVLYVDFHTPTGTGAFQVQVNNTTGTAANSVHGTGAAGSRPFGSPVLDLAGHANEVAPGTLRIPISPRVAGAEHLATSTISLRLEGGAGLTITGIRLYGFADPIDIPGPPCCAPSCDCDGDCGTADCDCEDVPPSIVLIGAPGTVDRAGVERILGDATGMASLLAADHFAAVGAATMVTRDGYVFVHSIANNASGLRVLPAALAGLQAGDVLRATGRTTGTVANSRLELAHIGAGAGAGIGNEAVHPGSAHSIPEEAFTFSHILTQGDITNGLRIAPNGWSWPSTPGTPAEWTARFGDFAFSIDDLIVFRPEVLAQHIDFNLAGNTAFQEEGRTGLATTVLNLSGGVATIHRYDNRNFVHIGSRTANWHGLNVTGLRAGVTQTIRVTGRTSGDWPTANGSLGFMEGGSGSLSFGAIAEGDGTFTLTGTVSEASTSFRIAANNYNAGAAEPELSGRTSFYIYSIIVGTDLDQPAADPADTVNVTEVEDFWPVLAPATGTGSVTITFDPLRNPLEQIAVNVPADELDGFDVVFALPAGFANPRWYRNAAPIAGATTATLTLDDTFDATVGRRHLVTFRADRTASGRTYSQIVAITVTAVTP